MLKTIIFHNLGIYIPFFLIRLHQIPNIEQAYRRLMSWPLVYNDDSRKDFKDFSMTDLGLSEKEATALTVSTVNLTSGGLFDIIMVNIIYSVLECHGSHIIISQMKESFVDKDTTLPEVLISLYSGDMVSNKVFITFNRCP